MSKAKELPSRELLQDRFVVDPTSPSGLRWRVNRGPRARAGGMAGSIDSSRAGYWVVGVEGKLYQVHRIVFELTYGGLVAGRLVDHIDGDSLNNDPANLRLADHAENTWNAQGWRNKETGLPKGIYPDGSGYRASIGHNGKRFWHCSPTLGGCMDWLSEQRQQLHSEFARAG